MVRYRPSRTSALPWLNHSIWLCGLSILFSSAAAAAGWQSEYDGFGRNRWGEDWIRLTPKAATTPGETHAALVLRSETVGRPIRDFHVSFRYRVRKQLRQPTASIHEWETLWFFFGYRRGETSKRTNYLLLKSNGIEVGRAWGDQEQSFLYTSPEPKVKNPREWQEVEIERRGSSLYATLNHGPTKEIHIPKSRALETHPGAIGLYTEDADVEIRDFSYAALD